MPFDHNIPANNSPNTSAQMPSQLTSLKALIDAGASTKLADRSGRTPLELARSRGYAAMVRMLEAAPR